MLLFFLNLHSDGFYSRPFSMFEWLRVLWLFQMGLDQTRTSVDTTSPYHRVSETNSLPILWFCGKVVTRRVGFKLIALLLVSTMILALKVRKPTIQTTEYILPSTLSLTFQFSLLRPYSADHHIASFINTPSPFIMLRDPAEHSMASRSVNTNPVFTGLNTAIMDSTDKWRCIIPNLPSHAIMVWLLVC